MKKGRLSLLIIFLLIIFVSLPALARPVIYVSVFPLFDLVELIGGEKVEVRQLVPHGADAHGYEPSPRRLADLEGADIFFYIGLGMEPWAEKAVSNLDEAGVKTVKVSEVARLRKFDEDHDHEHDNDHDQSHDQGHDHEEHHKHGSYDPHIWLDFDNMIRIGELVRDKLAELSPEKSDYFAQNFSEYVEKVEELDEKYQQVLDQRHSDYILTSHAAFGYLAASFGLKEISVSGISPHAEPSPHALARLIREVEEHGINYIFLETLASPRTAHVLAEEANLEILTLNPVEGLTLEEREKGEDYFSLMEQNLESLKKALVDENG